jgi:hypothetical protein
MSIYNFAAFILSHGRAERVYTYNSLIKHGYSGRVFIVIDDEDKQRDKYIEKFGDKVIIFNKDAVAKRIDLADNFEGNKAIIYARNACFDIAKDLGINYFIQLDDDYTRFAYKFTDGLEYKEHDILNLNAIFDSMLRYYNNIPATSIAMAQNGDYIGGGNSSFAKAIKPKRKAMNTFICSTARHFTFNGKINEDVNTYTSQGAIGKLFLTIPQVSINQKQTQSNKGGMTATYLDGGTYVKSFYSVIFSPSCVKIKEMGHTHKRLHHNIRWNNAVPVIVDEKYKK